MTLVPINDGLRHRPRSEWGIVYLHTEVCNAQIWLQSVMKEEESENQSPDQSDQISISESQSVSISGAGECIKSIQSQSVIETNHNK